MYSPECGCGLCAAETMWRRLHGLPTVAGNWLQPAEDLAAQIMRDREVHEDGDGDERYVIDDLPF